MEQPQSEKTSHSQSTKNVFAPLEAGASLSTMICYETGQKEVA
jgi:hypothetical protein